MQCDFEGNHSSEPCWGEIEIVKEQILDNGEFYYRYDIHCCQGHKTCFIGTTRYYSIKQNEASQTD